MEFQLFPQRMTMFRVSNNCMFCTEPKGQVYECYVYLQEKCGYYSCGNCRDKLQAAVKQWNEQLAFGRANRLQNRDIFIKRKSGEMQLGWRLNNPFVSMHEERETLHCVNAELGLVRWCYIDDLLIWNP